jgi:hypothetical protein
LVPFNPNRFDPLHLTKCGWWIRRRTPKKIEAADKIALSAAGCTWLLSKQTGVGKDSIFLREVATQPPNTSVKWTTSIGTLEEWIVEQKDSESSESKLLKDVSLIQRCSGLKVFHAFSGGSKIYVPLARRLALFKHNAIGHLGHDDFLLELSRRFYWPTLKKDCRDWYQLCPNCELSKAKRNCSCTVPCHSWGGTPPAMGGRLHRHWHRR